MFIKFRSTGKFKLIHCINVCALFFLGCEKEVEFEIREDELRVDVSNFPCRQIGEDNNSCRYSPRYRLWSKDNCDVCKTYTWLYEDIHYYLSVYMTQGNGYPKSIEEMLNPANGLPFITDEEIPFITHEELRGYQYWFQYPGRHNPGSFDVGITHPNGQVTGNWDLLFK